MDHRLTSLLRPRRTIAVLATLVIVGITTSGCIIVPVPMVQEYGQIQSSDLAKFVGKAKDQVLFDLGKPTYDFRGFESDESYFVYGGYTTSHLLMLAFNFEVPTTKIPLAGDTLCYLIVFDTEQRVTRHEARQGDDSFCPNYFWSEDTLRSMLVAEAERGNKDASVILASKFQDRSYLMWLAKNGDQDAAVILAEEFHVSEPLRMLAEGGDKESAIALVRQTGETTTTLRTMAENGDRASALALAQYARELEPLELLASGGDYEAAHMLAERFNDDSYLKHLGKNDDYVVAFEEYQITPMTAQPMQFFAMWTKLCRAANAGYAIAQVEVGHWHRRSVQTSWAGRNEERQELLEKVGVEADDRIAYR